VGRRARLEAVVKRIIIPSLPLPGIEHRSSSPKPSLCIDWTYLTILYSIIRGCIQMFPDWVDNEMYAYLRYYTLRSNTKGHGGKTHWTDSQNSDTTAPSGWEMYHLQFLFQAASPETFGYTIVLTLLRDEYKLWSFSLSNCLYSYFTLLQVDLQIDSSTIFPTCSQSM